MTVFNVTEKQQKSPFLLSGLLQKSSLQNHKSSFTVKFSPCSSLEVTCFLFYSFPGPKPFVQCILTLPRFSILRLHWALRKSQNF